MRENTLDSDVKTQQQPKTNKNNKKNQLSKPPGALTMNRDYGRPGLNQSS